MKVVIAFILSYVAVISGSKCDLNAPLPEHLPMTFLEKITGRWYQTVSSNDYISAQYICGTLSIVSVDSEHENFTALVTKYYSKAIPRPFSIYLHKETDGYFKRPRLDYREIAAHDFDQYGRLNVKALEEDDHVIFHPEEVFSFISDGANYFAYVNCTPEGWAVWIFTPQKVLKTEEFLYIHNELVKYGIHTELRLGKCDDFNHK